MTSLDLKAIRYVHTSKGVSSEVIASSSVSKTGGSGGNSGAR